MTYALKGHNKEFCILHSAIGEKNTKDRDVAKLLVAEIGPECLVDVDQDLSRYFNDWSGDHKGQALTVVRPSSVELFCKMMSVCAQHDIAVVPQGGNTGLVSGAIDKTGGCVVVSLERLNKVRKINASNLTATVDAGCILHNVKQAVSGHGLTFPVSLGAEGSAQIGGIVSTNAGGTDVVKYGMTRNNILGLEVVLPDGTLWSNLSGLRKDNRGPDLSQFFIGGEGAFGIVTGACLKLSPTPQTVEVAYVGCSDFTAAMALLHKLREQSHEFLSGFEIMSQKCMPFATSVSADIRIPLKLSAPVHILIELSCAGNLPLREQLEQFLGTALDAGDITDAAIAQNEGQAKAFWRIRETLVEGHALNGYHVRSDVSVTLDLIPELINDLETMLTRDFATWTAQTYGHAGDGNVHFNAIPPEALTAEQMREVGADIEDRIFEIVEHFKGSFSAEHGVGRTKRDRLQKAADPVHMNLLSMFKTAIDPHGLMNPGCLIQHREQKL